MYYPLSHPNPEDTAVIRTLRNALMKVVPTYLKSTTVATFCRSEMKVENTDIEIDSVISIRMMAAWDQRDNKWHQIARNNLELVILIGRRAGVGNQFGLTHRNIWH